MQGYKVHSFKYIHWKYFSTQILALQYEPCKSALCFLVCSSYYIHLPNMVSFLCMGILWHLTRSLTTKIPLYKLNRLKTCNRLTLLCVIFMDEHNLLNASKTKGCFNIIWKEVLPFVIRKVQLYIGNSSTSEHFAVFTEITPGSFVIYYMSFQWQVNLVRCLKKK